MHESKGRNKKEERNTEGKKDVNMKERKEYIHKEKQK